MDRRPDDTIEKLWVAAVECFAVGGACQLLHVVDHVIAARGSRLFLPARKEGIIPGASNLRLPRFVGDRAARQAILSGREWTAGDADAALLCDEVVEPGEMDRAVSARIEALTNSGLVNATANRRTLRAGQEPLDLFREYMSTYAREQARCHLSPALVRQPGSALACPRAQQLSGRSLRGLRCASRRTPGRRCRGPPGRRRHLRRRTPRP